MNKRDSMLSFLKGLSPPSYAPAAFFLHFDPLFHKGQAAVDKHMAYFHHTGMDFVKIQYEHVFPQLPEIQTPDDWALMPLYGADFYREPLKVVRGLVEAAKDEALVILTLYSPFMCAGHTTSDATITEHLKKDPEKVKAGLEIITESLLRFVKACIRIGVDGFYASTQGGEAHRFKDPTLFETYIKPYDRVLMQEINRACPFNILHICDYHGGYDDLMPFLDYPGHVVNCSLQVGETTLSPSEAAQLFKRPFMGGLDRHGVITSGDKAAIKARVQTVLDSAPERFVLGADCTLPSDIDWDDVRLAITTAHNAGAN